MGERKTRCKKITAPYPFFFNALYEIWQMEMCCQMIQYLSYCIGNEKYAFHDANPNFYPFTNWSWEVHFKCKASDGCCYVRHYVYIHTLYIYVHIYMLVCYIYLYKMYILTSLVMTITEQERPSRREQRWPYNNFLSQCFFLMLFPDPL